MFVLGGSAVLLMTFPGRNRPVERAVTYLFYFFMAAHLAGLDVSAPWPAFLEACVAITALLLVTALVRYGRNELAEGEYD